MRPIVQGIDWIPGLAVGRNGALRRECQALRGMERDEWAEANRQFAAWLAEHPQRRPPTFYAPDQVGKEDAREQAEQWCESIWPSAQARADRRQADVASTRGDITHV